MSKCERILDAARAAEASVTGTLGFSFCDLQSGESCYLHGAEMFPTASVYKVFILLELYRQAAEGRVDLSEMIPSPVEDISLGSGILSRLTPGISLPIRDMATLMMVLSDNVATDVLFHLVGRDNIRSNVIVPLGLTGTKADYACGEMLNVFYRVDTSLSRDEQMAQTASARFRNSPEYTCRTEKSCCTTPVDMTAVYRALYDGKWVSAETSAEILSMMRPEPAKSRITRDLPRGVYAAKKGGAMDRIVNDTGIVYTPKGNYIITMFYNGNTASEEEYQAQWDRALGQDLLATLSRRVYDIFVSEE